MFRYPGDTKVIFIKRVVGLPGDTLVARDGRLYIDGRRLAEPYLHRTGGAADATRAAAPLEGTTMHEPWSLSAPYRVPARSFFVMGDNRSDSDDSRDWGVVPEDDVIGEAFVLYWPIGRWRGL